MEGGGYDLKWKNHLKEVVGNLQVLREKDAFSDISLYCDGEIFRAHKVLLAACSTFFERLLARLPSSKSDCIVLLETPAEMLSLTLDFIYNGEVFVAADSLNQFMATAEKLEIRGLRRVGDSAVEEKSGVSTDVRSLKRNVSAFAADVDAIAPQVEIDEAEDEAYISAKRTRMEGNNAGGARKHGDSVTNGDFGASMLAGFAAQGQGVKKREQEESEWNGDTRGEDGYFGQGENEEEHFPETSFEGGYVDRPRHIPPEIDPNGPIYRWKPELPIWHGLSSASGNQLYFCGICDYSSMYNWNVKTHLMKHTGEKPFRCSICNWASRYKSSLKNHLGSRHNIFP